MADDPREGRKVAPTIVLGVALGIGLFGLLAANADRLREWRDSERVGTQYV